MKECNKIKKLFGLYLYDKVTPAERAAIEKHIDKCKECADDLRSRQEVLEKLQPSSQIEDMPPKIQDGFAYSVYRKIAAESIQKRPRPVFLRQFILQPSLATIALIAGIGIGFLRFNPGTVMVGEPSSSIVKVDETDKKELRAASYVAEFLEREGMVYTYEPSYVVMDSASTTERPLSDIDPFMQDILRTNSRRRLEHANLIYSLGEHERALAAYQRLVDDHPNTNAATEAQGKISTILSVGI